MPKYGQTGEEIAVAKRMSKTFLWEKEKIKQQKHKLEINPITSISEMKSPKKNIRQPSSDKDPYHFVYSYHSLCLFRGNIILYYSILLLQFQKLFAFDHQRLKLPSS